MDLLSNLSLSAAACLVASALAIFRSIQFSSKYELLFYLLLQVTQSIFLAQVQQAVFLLFCQTCICAVGPFLLCQNVFLRGKNRIYGIWDEAEMNLDS